jgi:hypothetical protein
MTDQIGFRCEYDSANSGELTEVVLPYGGHIFGQAIAAVHL